MSSQSEVQCQIEFTYDSEILDTNTNPFSQKWVLAKILVKNNKRLIYIAEEIYRNLRSNKYKYGSLFLKEIFRLARRSKFGNVEYINESTPNLELRSYVEKEILNKKTKNLNKLLFLLPVDKYGFNFGQFRIASHLLTREISIADIEFLHVNYQNKTYNIDFQKLNTKFKKIQANIIIQTGYTFIADEIRNANSRIKERHPDSFIVLGGPVVFDNFDYSLKMGADILVRGHGEYPMEYILKILNGRKKSELSERDIENINKLPGVYMLGGNPVEENIDFMNSIGIQDYIPWKYELIEKMYVHQRKNIQLFTSEKCEGNCIFCHRNRKIRNNYISNDELIKRLHELKVYLSEKKAYSISQIIFYDDDFYSGGIRNRAFMRKLYELVDEEFSVYELSSSVRSLVDIILKDGQGKDSSINMLTKIGVKRITVGADGFNENDLIWLRKKSSIKDIGMVTDKFSKSGIPLLLYVILTTFETSPMDFIESLNNIIELLCKEKIYLSPDIALGCIVSNGNKRLYGKFENENFKYIKIININMSINSHLNDRKIFREGLVLPKNRLVRSIVEKIGEVKKYESAYFVSIIVIAIRELYREKRYWNFVGSESLEERSKIRARLKKNKMKLNLIKDEKLDFQGEEIVDRLNEINETKRKIEDDNDILRILSDEKRIRAEKEYTEKVFQKLEKCLVKKSGLDFKADNKLMNIISNDSTNIKYSDIITLMTYLSLIILKINYSRSIAFQEKNKEYIEKVIRKCTQLPHADEALGKIKTEIESALKKLCYEEKSVV